MHHTPVLTPITLRYGVPDLTVGPQDRARFRSPPMASVHTINQNLRDFDHSTDITKGPAGLDVQGFTFLQHKSAITATSPDKFSVEELQDVYYPEVKDLIRDVTGAKDVEIVLTFFRDAHADFSSESRKKNVTRDSERGRMLEAVPATPAPVVKAGGAPVPLVHVDFTQQGLRDTIRYSTRVMKKAGQAAIDAEDAGLPAPRYAAYSVWRPLRTVKKDPITVCDWRSLKPGNSTEVKIRAPSEIQEEYNVIGTYLKPDLDHAAKHEWYWRPNMTPEDVCIMKLGDSFSASDPKMAEHSPHAAAQLLEDKDGEEARASLDCRVIAFW